MSYRFYPLELRVIILSIACHSQNYLLERCLFFCQIAKLNKKAALARLSTLVQTNIAYIQIVNFQIYDKFSILTFFDTAYAIFRRMNPNVRYKAIYRERDYFIESAAYRFILTSCVRQSINKRGTRFDTSNS